MSKYKIVGKTNVLVARKDERFAGKCNIVIIDNLTLAEAKNEILAMFNADYKTNYSSWDEAQKKQILMANKFGYQHDNKYFSIVNQ